MKKLLVALILLAGCAAAQIVNPGGNGGSGGGGASPAGTSTADAQCWASASTFGVCANIILSGAITAPGGFLSGGTPPPLTPGTGGPLALAEGTAPSVCAASAVDCIYASAIQHGLLASFNNGSYLPLVQGPTSATPGHVATFNGANGGLLQDGGVLPAVTGGTCTNQVVTAISGSAVPTCTTITSAYTTGFALLAAANNFTVGPQNITLAPGANTAVDGWQFYNTTVASSGNQQYCPSLHLQGQGWKTNSTAASQSADWYLNCITVQGAASPTSQFNINSFINGVNNFTLFGVNSNGLSNSGTNTNGTPTVFANDSRSGFSTQQFHFNIQTNNTFVADFNNVFNGGSPVLSMGSNAGFCFVNSTTTIATTPNACMGLDASGIINFNNGIPGTAAANYRAIKASANYIAGTTFTASGCSNGTLVGGATGGTFASGTTGACTVVITMGNSATAPTGWHCSASDRTTPANLYDQTASTITTATLSGTTVSGDVISFACLGY